MRLSTIRWVKAAVERWVGKATPWVAFLCLAAAMLFDPGKVGVPSASFAAALALASVTFSYARTLKEGSGIRDELVFAGERLATGAMLFLMAAILKYASTDIPRYGAFLFESLPKRNDALDPGPFLLGVSVIISLVAFAVFLFGLIFAQMGMSIVIAIAKHRAKRQPVHTDFFPANKSLEQRISRLDLVDAGETVPVNGETVEQRGG